MIITGSKAGSKAAATGNLGTVVRAAVLYVCFPAASITRKQMVCVLTCPSALLLTDAVRFDSTALDV